MSKSHTFKPWTHEDLGIPHMLYIAGRDVTILFTPNLLKVVKRDEPTKRALLKGDFYEIVSGDYGAAEYREHAIHIWPGNENWKPNKERMQAVILEEIAHWIFFVLHINGSDLDSGPLRKNEMFVQGFTEIWLQVQRQLKDFTKELKDLGINNDSKL